MGRGGGPGLWFDTLVGSYGKTLMELYEKMRATPDPMLLARTQEWPSLKASLRWILSMG